MSKLSKKRESAIYKAVHDRLVNLRIEVARMTNGTKIGAELDVKIARAQGDAAWGAVKAAKGES